MDGGGSGRAGKGSLRGGEQRRGRSSLTSCSGPMGGRGGGQVGAMMIDRGQPVRGHVRVARGRQIAKSCLNRQPPESDT